MSLKEAINNENINEEALQKGLKYIGLDLSKFNQVPVDLFPQLIELFKIAINIDPHTSSKMVKMDTRSKLEKILRSKAANYDSSVNKTTTIPKESSTENANKSFKSLSDLPVEKRVSVKNIKLGKVKFFDSLKGFGYIHSLDDKRDCYVNDSRLLTPKISDDDIVLLETTDSRKKPGELEAKNVSNKIPVFIFNKSASLKSSAFILLENKITQEISLSSKLEDGFVFTTARQSGSSWRISPIDNESIPKQDQLHFGRIILSNLLLDLTGNKDVINYLFSLLRNDMPDGEITETLISSASSIEKKTVSEINTAVKSYSEFDWFEDFVSRHSQSLSKISFVLWAQNSIEKLPSAKNQEEVDVWRFEIIPSLNSSSLVQVLQKLNAEKGDSKQIEATYKFLLEQGISISSDEDYEIAEQILITLKSYYPEIPIKEENFECENSEYFFRLYKSDLLYYLSDELIQNHISDLDNDETKVSFIESFSKEDVFRFYALIPELVPYYEKYLSSIIAGELSSIPYLSFDIESDRNKIFEFAWIDRNNSKCEKDFEKFEDGLNDLFLRLNAAEIIVGHNVKQFDIPVLKEHGLQEIDEKVWDTFEIEMLLNPCRFSYALKTEHNASADSVLALNLFKNQICRFVKLDDYSIALMEFLPQGVIDYIEDVKQNPIWKDLSSSVFETQSDTFFRPAPSYNNIQSSVIDSVNQLVSDSSANLIIAPSFLWDTLSHNFSFHFIDKETNYNYVVTESKVIDNLSSDNFLKNVLIRYVQTSKENGHVPYYRHLPTAIKLKLTFEQENQICDAGNTFDFAAITGNYCVAPQNTVLIKSFVKAQPSAKIIIVGKELYALTSKLQLGRDIDFATIFDKLKHEPIWLQMSGGKNYISLDQRQCTLLGIEEFPSFLQNLWMEKIGKGRFKIWCNINFDLFIESLNNSNFHYVQWNDENLKKNNAFVVRPDSKRSGYIAEQKRVNPESLFRKLYWVYQFKIIESLYQHSKSPKVLVINDESEISLLCSYARQLGYFVPDTNASLARQIEIIHDHKSTRKLSVIPFEKIDKVLYFNYLGSIDFIWDSFLLYEKYQMLQGIKDISSPDANDEITDNIKEDGSFQNKIFDLFKLIKEHQSLIDYYYKLIIDNNPDSKLFLCDTRFTDYYGIETSLGTKSVNAILWQKEKDYIADSEIASQFFKPIHENADVDFNVEEAKEILRHIFLTSEDGETVHKWYDYQHPCLNDILPAKKDLLISLPTGAGKSLLFQGPALFRSAFSCKLSIVISPLRALMQDQVDALWNKGFYSNVEFLSADKSHVEIRDIYRRIAGGEIALLYITPERFRSRAFENSLFTRLDADSGLEFVIFDEAHCISQWGQEFRPDYLNAGRKIADISNTPSFNLRKLLFSATISDQVYEEICTVMPGIQLVDGTEKSYNPVRDHISISFKHNIIDDERLNEVAEYLKSGKFNPKLSRAIIFVKSRRKTEECALLMPDCLKDNFGGSCDFSDKVGGFHAGMDAEDRKETYEKFKNGEIVILFATKAFGMGMDIPNIHYIAHYSPPSTFEDFLQEIGRAGRNEEKRIQAGFNNKENPIKSLCLTSNNDFAKLKDQLHESRISWHEVKEIKDSIEKYVSNFKKLEPDTETPIAVPFNMYSAMKGSVDDDLDNKFRLSLHWLERLERIKLGYFTITHLEFESDSIKTLHSRLNSCNDEEVKKVCTILLSFVNSDLLENPVIQVSIASLRGATKLSLEQLFVSLIKAHNLGLLKLLQDVVIEPTKIRTTETDFCRNRQYDSYKYLALKVVFSFAREIFKTVPSNDSKSFDGEELDNILNNTLSEHISFQQLPWSKKENPESRIKECKNYVKDLKKKRSKHAFTVIRLLGKTKHDTKMEKLIDSNKKFVVRHTIFNGYHKPDEWKNKLSQFEKDSFKLLDHISNKYFDNNVKKFNLAELIANVGLQNNVQYLSDLLFVLSVLGYVRTGGMLPTGIEVYINSLDKVNETDIQSLDKRIFDEFEQTRKLRELKLISLEVLSGIEKSKHDQFIRKYFACGSMESLLKLLEEELPKGSRVLAQFREEAIKNEEDRLKPEQRKVYDSEINQHINVVAGPGSGKTHTLTLRVARLVHHIGTPPEEILVLAYNRAVVSELKERLSTLFSNLGYESLARRLKIFTFHGMAKKYCYEEVEGRPFDEWERILLRKLNTSPGTVMNQIGNIRHILVDEFQDINNVRVALLKKLMELTNSYIFIIGDPNQSIYGYERIKDNNGSMSPWPYYKDFKTIFNPTEFTLIENHRSYPNILSEAAKLLNLPAELKHLIPKPTRAPEEGFIANYCEINEGAVNTTSVWPSRIPQLIQERVNNKPYKQIAILFRTNNEVYQGYQKIKALDLPNIRIRIQGSLPYEFTRIRECHAVIHQLKANVGNFLPTDFREKVRSTINQLIQQNPNWNHFYLRMVHALILDFLDDVDETMLYDNLIDYISELTYRDDGQLYKIYEKHRSKISPTTHETEIVLTTMHKVKGLEFDVVLLPSSLSNLPLVSDYNGNSAPASDQIEEEKRLMFVSYTRARYRLIVYKGPREISMQRNQTYTIPDNINLNLGIPVKPEISKLKIGWAAKSYNFCNRRVNDYIKSSIKSGDFVFVKKRIVPYNGSSFVVHELFKLNTTNAIGELARDSNILGQNERVSGFVVNEVVVWSYEDTRKFDNEHGTNFSNDWCEEAKNTGYIYLVDFAGYGKIEN